MSDVIEKANELAEAIVNSSELKLMREAEMTMNNDDDAVNILDEFREQQQKVYQLQMTGQQLSDQDRLEVAAIEGKMGGNAKIKAYMEASEKFERMLQSVNQIITRALSGDEGCDCGCDGGSCGSGCGGCG